MKTMMYLLLLGFSFSGTASALNLKCIGNSGAVYEKAIITDANSPKFKIKVMFSKGSKVTIPYFGSTDKLFYADPFENFAWKFFGSYRLVQRPTFPKRTTLYIKDTLNKKNYSFTCR